MIVCILCFFCTLCCAVHNTAYKNVHCILSVVMALVENLVIIWITLYLYNLCLDIFCYWLYSVWFRTPCCALHCIYWACQWLWWAILTPFGSIFLSGSFSTASQLNKSCFFHIQIAPIFSWTMPEWNISDRNWQEQRLRVERNAEERLWGNAVIQFVLARVCVCAENYWECRNRLVCS